MGRGIWRHVHKIHGTAPCSQETSSQRFRLVTWDYREGVEISCWVGLCGCGLFEEPTKVDEVRLRRGTLLERHPAPPIHELLWRQPHHPPEMLAGRERRRLARRPFTEVMPRRYGS